MAQWVKNAPAKQETQEKGVRSPGREDPLEKGLAAHSSILAWRIPWTEDPGWLQSMGSQRVECDSATKQTQMVSVYNSVALNTFMIFYSHHQNLFIALFHPPPKQTALIKY